MTTSLSASPIHTIAAFDVRGPVLGELEAAYVLDVDVTTSAWADVFTVRRVVFHETLGQVMSRVVAFSVARPGVDASNIVAPSLDDVAAYWHRLAATEGCRQLDHELILAQITEARDDFLRDARAAAAREARSVRNDDDWEI